MNRRSILIVEDDALNRSILKTQLEGIYNIYEAGDGEEGLAILRKRYGEFSVVLLDLVMPKLSGYDFLKEVKDDFLLSGIPVIVITGNGTEAEERTCLNLGAVDFIKKPYDLDIVKSRIRNVIRIKESSAVFGIIERDDLTQTYTKQAFFQRAKQKLMRESSVSYDFFIADIENFKLVNNIYGENTGDIVLAYLGERIARLAKNGLVGRFSGDQFVGMVPAGEKRMHDRIAQMEKDIVDHAPVANLVIKYGIYENVDPELPVSTMCDRAIAAMRSIKHNFNRTVAVYDEPLSQKQQKEFIMETSFDAAIQDEEFEVWYQPKYDINSEVMLEAEALVRWKLPEGFLRSPIEFIPLFEDDGLIGRLDEYVFRRVCRDIRSWLDEGITPVRISVNLSRTSIHCAETAKRYKEIVDEYQVPMKYLAIELTESAAFHSIQVKELLEELREVGFQLYMDDFGSGFSSLASLNILSFDVIKLDKSLIDAIGNPGGNEILRHIIELAHFLNMTVVAEGVEKKEQIQFLRKLKCDQIQGYYFSRPKRHEDFRTMLEEN